VFVNIQIQKKMDQRKVISVGSAYKVVSFYLAVMAFKAIQALLLHLFIFYHICPLLFTNGHRIRIPYSEHPGMK